MRDDDTGAPTEPVATEDSAAGEPVRRQRLSISARATLLMGLSMGTIVAVTAVLPAASSSTSKP